MAALQVLLLMEQPVLLLLVVAVRVRILAILALVVEVK